MPLTYVLCEQCRRMNRAQTDSAKEAVCGACKASLPIHGAIVDATDATFADLVAKSPVPVVLDVWAPWCGPCRAFAPTFEELGADFAGKIVFAKLNSDENQATAGRLGVRGIPTLVIFKNGKEITRQSGALSREHFKQWLEQFGT